MNQDYSKTTAIGGGAMCSMSDPELIHLMADDYAAVCGADRILQRMTTIRENVTCLCCLGRHRWKAKQMGGPPDDAISAEWVSICADCGVEDQGSNPRLG